jgi:hypothetical protein
MASAEAATDQGVHDPPLQQEVKDEERQRGQPGRGQEGTVVDIVDVEQVPDADLQDRVGAVVTMRGHRYSFQAPMNNRISGAASEGPRFGTTT